MVARAPATPARQTRLRARDQVSFLTNGHDPESCSVGARAVCDRQTAWGRGRCVPGRRRGGARARQTGPGPSSPGGLAEPREAAADRGIAPLSSA